VRHRGAELGVDGQPAAVVGDEPGRGEVQLVGRAGPPRREEDKVANDPLARLEEEYAPPRRAVRHLEALHRLAESEGDVALPHLVDELVHELPVREVEDPVSPLDHGDLDPERGEDRGVLDPDDPAPHDGHRPGQPLQADDVVAGDRHLAVHHRPGRRHRARADRHDDPLRAHRTGPGLRPHEERVRILEPRLAPDHGDVVPPELVVEHLDLPAHDVADAGEELRCGRAGAGRRA
jgi:hypothetical protein